MLFYIAVGVVIAAVIIGVIFNFKRSKAINENGIEVDAVVSRIKETEGEDSDGNTEFSSTYYVKYKNEQGETVEAKLGNPPRFLMEESSCE